MMKMTDEELQAKFLYDNGTLRNKFAIKNAGELSLMNVGRKSRDFSHGMDRPLQAR
ncbi:hypothetical protein LHV14_07385 [Limosilactobacillus reuteri]|nr:hypothetical protein [Limosilactobacillus reuteri]MCH5379761.1 hypothetical protein [Limosilactobacillus reuteri]